MATVNDPYMNGKEWEYLKECIDTNWVSYNGKFVKEFENKFAEFVGAKYAVAVVSGTAAVHLALVLAGVMPNDEVLVPSYTFVASVNPIRYQFADPVFIDSEMKTWNMDPEQIEKMITEKTKAIEVVHIFGQPALIKEIMAIANKYNLPVIEDATESLGATVEGKMVGTFGKIGAFSFNGNKLITAGGGGMIVTDDEEIATRARYLSTQARDGEEYIHGAVGYNYRLTNIQAAVGLAQLEQIESFLEIRRRNGLLYKELLKDIPGIETTPELPNTKTSFWMNAILVDESITGVSPITIREYLLKYNIPTRPFFVPTHTFSYLNTFKKSGNMENANKLYKQGICLPSSVTVTEKEVYKICELIKQCLQINN